MVYINYEILTKQFHVKIPQRQSELLKSPSSRYSGTVRPVLKLFPHMIVDISSISMLGRLLVHSVPQYQRIPH